MNRSEEFHRILMDRTRGMYDEIVLAVRKMERLVMNVSERLVEVWLPLEGFRRLFSPASNETSEIHILVSELYPSLDQILYNLENQAQTDLQNFRDEIVRLQELAGVLSEVVRPDIDYLRYKSLWETMGESAGELERLIEFVDERQELLSNSALVRWLAHPDLIPGSSCDLITEWLQDTFPNPVPKDVIEYRLIGFFGRHLRIFLPRRIFRLIFEELLDKEKPLSGYELVPIMLNHLMGHLDP